MALRARTAAVGAALVAAALITASPRLAFGPGPLSPGHAGLTDRCLACHAPLRGVPAARCLGCHPLAKIGAARDARPANPVLARLHALASSADCLECHGGHAGATPRFAHTRLPQSERSNCQGCHLARRPDDQPHRQGGESCDACHGTEAWRPANMDHARLAAGQACVTCHAGRRPQDALHAQAGDACGTCHATGAWRPATFAHERFFLLDRDHNVACGTCHGDAGGYRTYTCYGCHEHTPAGMAAEHRKESVRDLDNCVRCHRSPDEPGGRGGRGGSEGDEE